MIEGKLDVIVFLGLAALATVILMVSEYRHSRKQEKGDE